VIVNVANTKSLGRRVHERSETRFGKKDAFSGGKSKRLGNHKATQINLSLMVQADAYGFDSLLLL
jgi:hypothetical protein